MLKLFDEKSFWTSEDIDLLFSKAFFSLLDTDSSELTLEQEPWLKIVEEQSHTQLLMILDEHLSDTFDANE